MKETIRLLPLLAVLLAAGCAPSNPSPEDLALQRLKQARSVKLTTEQRAVLYLDAARDASMMLGNDPSGEARATYNKAVTDLTVLLRGETNPAFWNQPVQLAYGGTSYRLRFAKPSRDGIYDPDWFTSLTPADEVDMDSVKNRHWQDGIGGALVGVRKTSPLEPFSPKVGVSAPVTAVLDFNGRDATLSLIDPTEKNKALVQGKQRALAADFSAPLAYYPHVSEFWSGLMGAIHADEQMGITGLYQLQPYDPERIPLIFVHGLISTPRMWRNVINELETDPLIRRKYQCWVFAYPTGNPPAYSALRLREELQKFHQVHPKAKDIVMVGHSMGGLLTRIQLTSLERGHWDVIGEQKAAAIFKNVKPGDLIHRCTIYQANPRIDRAIFICTPHRGSRMAVGTLGELAIRLISLPLDIASTAANTLGASTAIITGDPGRIPTSIDGLSPRNPSFKLLESRPIEAPHHSIIGDRGKGGSPDSSDGVVEYWSSNLKSAKSEKIVPGPHGACELPETLEELRRILHLHLESNP
jgi:pimeloyl-ACP methyl ester carboxylesterase